MKMAPKDAEKVRGLHGQLMAVADKYDMSMEELLELAMEGEMPESEEEESMEMEEPEEQSAGPDKAKIALIVGKMRRGEME